MTAVPPRARQWLQATIGDSAHIDSLEALPGSTSSSLYVVSARTRNGGALRCVLRVFTNVEWLAAERDLAEHEASVLVAAAAMGLAGPRLIGFTPSDAEFGAPAVLMTLVDGAVLLRPARFDTWIERLAHTLASIHVLSPPTLRWRYKSWTDAAQIEIPAWSKDDGLWERAVEIAHAKPPSTTDVFIHRDYHPTNVLWRDDEVSGVVDWVNACLGPAGVDVAHCRLNLALMYGADAADAFLDAYTARATGFRYHPYWDMDSVFDSAMPAPKYYEPWRHFGLGDIAPTTLRARLEEHVTRIIERARSLPW